jgi:pyruvate/2-oxoglutarate dehydrogenase complex dihydrolipoamide dehydrogenase (E3) component
VLNDEVEVGNNIVIIGDDDDIQTLSTADFLAERGRKVEVICWGRHAGSKLEPMTFFTIYQRLLSKGVIITPHTRVKEISGGSIVTFNYYTDEERTIEGVDTFVVACGGLENNTLYYALKDRVKEIHLIGDAMGIRRIHHATMDGAMVGRAL